MERGRPREPAEPGPDDDPEELIFPDDDDPEGNEYLEEDEFEQANDGE